MLLQVVQNSIVVFLLNNLSFVCYFTVRTHDNYSNSYLMLAAVEKKLAVGSRAQVVTVPTGFS